ncbi:MAG: hypothetical protein IKZ98_07055 [Clostridia bacterium]|nr:hypothetical protein [Clostridia bacterium]
MFLPKPNVLAMPECAAPLGIGLDACNSGNKCNGQSGCDVYTPSNSGSGGGCGDGLTIGATAVGVGVTLAAAAVG